MKYLRSVGALILSCFIISFTANSQFIENKGQVLDLNQNFHPEVKYYFANNNAAVYFQNDRVVYNFMEVDQVDLALYSTDRQQYDEALKQREVTYHRMDLVFENANLNVNIKEGEKLQGVNHFYLNKRNGIRDVKSFKTLTYENIYPNIDIIFQNNKKGMKYDVVLKEGADLSNVQLKFEGYDLEIRDGKLVILAPFGNITEEIPLSFVDDDKSKTVDVEYVLNEDKTIGFKLKGKVNYSKLTIDPVLEWASYFNQLVDPPSASGRLDYISNHVDADGNYYTYGQGFSSAGNYPVVNPGGAYTDVYDNSSDLYLAKFDATRQLVWGTYIGGSGSDNASWGNPITTDGNILHIVGRDISTGAPFTNGGGFYEATANRNFWARFNRNTGALQHLTSLADGDHASIAISPSGIVAIVSDKFSFGHMPTLNRGGAYNQSVHGGSRDMTLLMFNASFNQIWGTFLGGPGSQEYFTCAFDSGDNLYFSGGTSWFGASNAANEQLVTLPGAYNQSVHGGANDIMLGKFNASGQLVWHTLYGGNSDEARAGQMGVPAKVLVHPTTDELILATNSTSTNLPVQTLAGAYNRGVPADTDFGAGGSFWNYAGYIAKFTSAGVRNWATYFYSNTNNSGTYIQNIVFGGCNKFYVGAAGADNTLTGAASGYNLLTSSTTSRNGYITMLDATGFSFEWDSYLNSDHALDCYVAANTNQARYFVVSPVWFENIPVTDPGGGAYYEANSWDAGSSSLGIFQFHPSLPPDVTDQTICSGESVTLTASGGMGAPYNWYATSTSSTILNTGSSYNVSPSSTTTYYVSSGTGICASPRVPVTVTVDPAPSAPSVSNNGPLCLGDNLNLTANTIPGATYNWTGPNGFSSSNEDPTITGITAAAAGTYNLTVEVSGCTSTAATTTLTLNTESTAPTSITGTNDICEGASTTLNINGGSAGTGANPQWYSGSCGSAVIGTNNSLIVSPTVTTTYFVAYSGTCNTTSCASITVNVTPAPGSPAWTNPGTVCEANGTIDLNTTVTGAPGGTWSGTGVSGSTFDPAGLSGSVNITYTTGSGACTDDLTQAITVTPQADPAWTTPGTVCENGGTINLNPTVTGDAGGTWSGTGVSGSTFDPTGLSGNINVTYTVGSAPCEEVSTQTITVTPAPGSPAWTNPGTVCEASGTIDLNTTVTGAPGGTWSGTGVSGSTFDPTGLSGSVNITYTTGSGACTDDLTQAITVTPQADPAWTSPGTVCESSGNIDLGATITGDPGGTWSGTGVSGSTFDPTGLSGQSIDVTYTVGTVPCEETLTQTIIVENAVTAAWTAPTDVCESDAPIDLTPFVTGSAGGSWSGSGISGSNFDPSGLSGTVTITYTVGVAPCTDSQDQIITVNSAPTDPTVSLDNDTICQGEAVEISASGSGTGITYNVYSDAQGNNLIGTTPLNVTPSTTTDYYVEAVNANNCTNSGGLQQVTVTVNPSPSVNAGPDQTICASEVITLNATGDGTLSWNTGDLGAQLVVAPSSTTTYTVTATDSNNCSASDEVTVTVNTPAGTLDAVDDLYNVTTNEISNLGILDNDDYTGSSPTIIQNPNNGIASVQSDGTVNYSSGADFIGSDTLTYEICDPLCVSYCDTAMVIIIVNETDDIVIPGGFSPNGDNINETFVIEGLSEYPNNVLTIFNRWGDIVFEAAPYQNDWDGTSSSGKVLFGDKVPPGTYFYILDLGDGTNAYRGSLELKY